MSKDLKRKRYCFTDFHDEFKFDEATMEYAIVGKEVCPDTGREHGQGFVCFRNRQRFSGAKRLVGLRAHIEPARGTVRENRDYCSKDGNFVEWGSAPKEPSVQGAEGTKRKWNQIYESAKDGNLEAIPREILVKHYSSLKRICFDNAHKEVRTLDHNTPAGLWIHGPPGVGKSLWARNNCKSLFEKQINKWWDGYSKQDVVLLDDFDHVHKCLGHHLKRWADVYPFNAEVKGGAMTIRPRGIIVTSNYAPHDIFDDVSMQEAINRRFKIVLDQSKESLAELHWSPPEYVPIVKEEVIDLTLDEDVVVENCP